MKKLQVIDIGKVVKLSGLPASTLRYYEEKGLIQSIGRNGLRRQYNDSVLEQLALISLGRSVGFSLEEIATMLTSNGPNIDRERLAAKANELDKSILQLTAMRDGLRHAANCPAPSHLECSKFKRLLNFTNKKNLRHKKK